MGSGVASSKSPPETLGYPESISLVALAVSPAKEPFRRDIEIVFTRYSLNFERVSQTQSWVRTAMFALEKW
jgi:hypothetical protein